MAETDKESLTNEEKYLKSLQKAVLSLETTRQELNELKQKQHEPIAIIGMGCRFPGGADTPDKFWKMLVEGKDAITTVPDSRWEISDYYDPDRAANGKMYTRKGGFLTEPIEQFDAHFFHISAAEAEMMDPQQRLLLEVTWEALENAGINPQSLKESQTGVFLGIVNHDFWDLLNQQAAESSSAYEATGNLTSITAGRLSYSFGLMGPSCAVDTACSSSLVALHLACQSLRSGESDLALAGGVNVMLNPEVFVSFCKAHMLSEDGYCKTFDASADGYARGEGCGMIVLKRLSDALADQDSILAVIKGTSTNQDGASSGLTVPNSAAQIELLRKAWQFAGIEAGQISYFEAHGTGTSLGDPIEVNAIQKAMEKDPKRQNPLWISSVKTNIGHLESAAGIAGIIKIISCLQNKAIPPHLHFHQLNPLIDLEGIPARIPLRLEPWELEGPRIAAISSFGIGGTNAHAVIEEAPQRLALQEAEKRALHPFVLSAKTEKALRELVDRYLDFIPHSEASIEDITYTANIGRAHFDYRIGCIVESKEDLVSKLKNAKENISHITTAPKYESKPHKQIPLGSDNETLKKHFEEIIQQYLNGENIDWKLLERPYQQRKVALPTYAFQRERYWPQELSQPKGASKCIFKLQWDETPLQPATRTLGGTWLVFTDQKPIPQAFTQHIELGGGSCIRVVPGDQFQKIDKKHYACNPLQADGFQKILQEIQTPLHGIAYFWGGSFLDIAQLDEESLNQAQALSCGGALSLMQSLIHMLDNGQACPPVWFVTEKAQPLEQDREINLVASPLIGLHRTFAQEYPQIQSSKVDIEMIDQLLKEVQNGHSDIQPAWRGNNRYIASIIRIEQQPERQKINDKGTYLITGGLGSLGLVIAESLIKQGARHLDLLGRRGLDNEIEKKIVELSKLGAEINYYSVDISNIKDVEKLLNEINQGERPLKGIIHAAGLSDNAVLRNQSWEKFEHLFGAKIAGSWNLHAITEKLNIPLDFFILFSSISSILGIASQANYSACNAFMDSLAHYRHTKNLPALSLNWGAWESMGMLSEDKDIVQLLQTQLPGFISFNAQTGEKAFETVLGYEGSQAIVSNMQIKDVETFSPYWKQLFKHILSRKEILSTNANDAQSPIYKNTIKKLKENTNKYEIIKEFLVKCISEITLHPEEQLLKKLSSTPLLNLGIDSLKIIELDKKIKWLNLHQSFTFNEIQHQSINQLTQAILENLDLENTPDSLESDNINPLSIAPEFHGEQKWAWLPDTMQFFWYLDLFKIGEQVPLTVYLNEAVNIELLEIAYNIVLKKHPIFFIKTKYFFPSYKVEPFQEQKISFIDLRGSGRKNEILLDILYKNLITKFGRKEIPKIKSMLIRLEEKQFIFNFVTPHYILDLRAAYELIKQIEKAYQCLKNNLLPPSFSQHANYLTTIKKFDHYVFQNIEAYRNLIENRDAKDYNIFNIKGLPYCQDARIAKKNFSKSLQESFHNSCLQNSRRLAPSISALLILALDIISKRPVDSFELIMNRVVNSEFENVVGPLTSTIFIKSKIIQEDSIENYLRKSNELVEEGEKMFHLPKIFFLPIQKHNFLLRLFSNILKPYFSFSNPISASRYSLKFLEFIRDGITFIFYPKKVMVWLQIIDPPHLEEFTINPDIFSQLRAKFIPANNIYFFSTSNNKEWWVYLISRLEPAMAEKCLEIFEDLINISITNPSMTISEILKKNGLERL